LANPATRSKRRRFARFEVDEVQRLIETALHRRNEIRYGIRFVIALRA